MKKTFFLLLALILVFVLSGCGEKETKEQPKETGDEQQVVLVATNFQFDQETYTVKKGEPVKFTLDSQQGAHGVKIKGLDVSLTKDGEFAIVTPNKAGTFDIICNVPCGGGHSKMVSKLVVE